MTALPHSISNGAPRSKAGNEVGPTTTDEAMKRTDENFSGMGGF